MVRKKKIIKIMGVLCQENSEISVMLRTELATLKS